MFLPDMTPAQLTVLAILRDGEQSGRHVREKLAENGERKGMPDFYQMMARLEDAGLVVGWYDEKIIDGQRIKERKYRITTAGKAAAVQIH